MTGKVIEMSVDSSLTPGGRFRYAGVWVTVLRAPEPTTDTFGRDMVRVWAKRDDTAAEGWMTFGPDSVPTINSKR